MELKTDLDELRFSVKYPFTSIAKSLVKRMNIDFNSLDPIVIDAAKKRIKEDLMGGTIINPDQRMTKGLEVQLLSYPIAKILISLSRNSYLKKKFSEGEANTFRKFISNATDEEIEFLAGELGLDLSEGKIYFKDYLRYMPEDEMYKLFYQDLYNGYIRLSPDVLIEIITTAYKLSLLNSLDKYPKEFESLKPELDDIKVKRFESFEYKGDVSAEAFPPCMKKIIADAAAGQHLGHTARFAIAAFLVNIGYPEDKIVDIFRSQPNFKEKLTRYHIEYLSGKKDGKKRLPPSCEKMKTYALCVNPDNLCARVKNPLSYYKLKMRRSKGGREKLAKR